MPFLRFAAVGAVGTLAHFALLLALVEGAGAPPLAGAGSTVRVKKTPREQTRPIILEQRTN